MTLSSASLLPQSNIIANSAETESAWLAIQNLLLQHIGEGRYKSLISPLRWHGMEGDAAIVTAPTRFMREWVSTHYASLIKMLLQKQDSSIRRLEMRVHAVAEENSDESTTIAGAQIGNSNVIALEQIVTFEAPELDRRFTFENFISGPENELALRAAQAISLNASAASGVSLFYLHGGVGQGKTHLLHAMAHVMQANNPALKICYLSAEKFMLKFVQSVRNRDVVSFKNLMRSADVLLMDDIQFLVGKEGTQEEFFHTLNSLCEQQKQVILACDRAPAMLETVDARLRSRLIGGLTVEIAPAQYSLRRNIIEKKLSLMPAVKIQDEVIELLATRISSNIRELEGALHRVLAQSTFLGINVSSSQCQNMLADLLQTQQTALSVDEIINITCAYFQIKTQDLLSSRRSRSIARPRQIAMYLCKNHTTKSLSEIGRMLGGKDHTTVMHAIKTIEQLLQNDHDMKKYLADLGEKISRR